ncbi:MAG: 50S ribosomal protein L22 [Candidatus Portnoybacteria bacterium RBG_19FT_COMBO_36_7]|uniref:Large ribosomal subunit protein uL22 n=1 Tax=Candidatus Portnoybacteria bacterium RBG_19FT_COMBO_36_7 TaxID=1801992 RepID=A0A1G2F7Y7_9BACT|nr:MAG: 50S ribosomal protein L22 [Candidatus Portnoybacteria bacterium RBG_19FT_COMBO_36_7]
MQVAARLNNLRMTPRKIRLVTSLVKGMDAKQAQSQLRFMNKKAAAIVLKLLNSGLSNAKHNFNLSEDNFYISSLQVEAGPSLKRWLPRAMGRATPILKRTCNINLVLEEKTPSKEIFTGIKKKSKIEKMKEAKKETGAAEKSVVEKEETISVVPEAREEKRRSTFVPKSFGDSEQSKKKFFSRQTLGNIKRVFRRKSI